MKTILYTVSQLNRSGPNMIIYGIIKHLDRSQYQPVLLTLSDSKDTSMVQEFSHLNVEIVNLHLSRLQSVLKGHKTFSKVLQHIQPDLIHCHGFRDMCLVAIWARKYPRIATIHCDFDTDYKLKYGFLLGNCMAKIQASILKYFLPRIAVSRLLSDILTEKHFPLFFEYVDNGVDTEYFHPISDKIPLRQELGLPENKITVLWAGSFIARKDPITWIHAIAQLDSEKFFCVLCGARGKLLDLCKNTLKGKKNILFTGYTVRIRDYMQASDIYISTALSEGLPCAVLEALSCGLPVILTDIPQHRYIFENQLGLLVAPQDSNSIAKSVLSLADNLHPEEAEVRHHYIEKNFSYQQMSHKYQAIYSKRFNKGEILKKRTDIA